MGLLAKFIYWLTSSAKGRPKKGHPDLYPIDVDKLARELHLLEEAKRLGEAGLPAIDAVTLSGPEAGVVQRVEKARQDYIDWAVLRMNVLSQELGKRNVTQEINRASQADKEFERKASALLTEQDGLLRGLGDVAIKRKAELESFKKENSLTRDAQYPLGAGTFLRYMVLLLLIIVEGVLNASFFSQGLNSGLLGGFTYAVILAATNVLIAFAFGKYPVRYVNHSSAALKALGYLSIVMAFTVMLSMGLGIAHFRDSLIAEAADPALAALQAILANPFQLRDFFSWALFLISIAFGLLALFDGLSSDDYYPGYGAITRHTLMAIDDYEDELNTLRNNLEAIKNDELSSLDVVVLQSQASASVFESLIEDKVMAGSRLSTALRDADNSLNALLSKFRTENELHRNGVQRPAYFDQQIDLRALQAPDFDTALDKAVLAEQRELVNKLLADVEGIRARIQAAFNHQFDRLKPLDTHFPSNGVA
jgi:hypothetical protein